MNPIYLKTSDLEDMKKNIIGRGSEGTIYKINNNILYKIYHQYMDYSEIITTPQYDEEGVNIARPIFSKKVNRNTIQFIDEEGVRLSREESILRAINCQKNVNHTKLPQNVIYVNGRIKGCSLHYHKYCKNIYCVVNLPLKLRLNILKQILENVKELVDNNIYHIDLSQHPTKECKNTNILLNPKLVPQIIDIDGHSAIYSAIPNSQYLKKTEFSFAVLMFELLSREYLDEYLSNPNTIDLYYLLENIVPDYLLSDFESNQLTLNKMSNFLNNYMKT